MYTEHFGLSEPPFSISPDPHYLYLSHRHREALAHLIYGTQQSGGFIQLTGEVGTGKTTLARALLEQLPENVDVALLINPKQSAIEFLHSICDELRIPYEDKSTKTFVDALNNYLLKAHEKQRHTVLLIDEAQNLTVDVLEQIRLLTNLETTQTKLLQIILVGQPELRVLLARKDLRQLAQRITARYHLLPLTENETAEFIQHRLSVAGQNRMIFNKKSLKQIYTISKGIPRLINIICDRGLLGAYSQGKHHIDTDTIKRASEEVSGEVVDTSSRQNILYKSAIAAGIVVFSLVTVYFTGIFSSGNSSNYVFNDNVNAQPTISSDVNDKSIKPDPQIWSTPSSENQTQEDLPGNDKLNQSTMSGSSAEKFNLAASTNTISGGNIPVTNSTMSRLKELLNAKKIRSDSESAYAELFSVWSMDYYNVTGTSSCEKANQLGLSCWRSKGTWNNLRVVNRPAIIELVDSGNNRYYVVVTSIIDNQVNLSFAGKAYSFLTVEVDPYWYGSFVVLWRQPPVDMETIYLGVRGSAALWLKQTLNKVDGLPSPDDLDNIFDKTLELRVKAFQRERYLNDDGLVGKQTMINLNTALNDPTIPLLWKNKQENNDSQQAIQ